jgi:hypothetical protein
VTDHFGVVTQADYVGAYHGPRSSADSAGSVRVRVLRESVGDWYSHISDFADLTSKPVHRRDLERTATMKNQGLKRLAKQLAAHGYRNNTAIEDIHAGQWPTEAATVRPMRSRAVEFHWLARRPKTDRSLGREPINRPR